MEEGNDWRTTAQIRFQRDMQQRKEKKESSID